MTTSRRLGVAATIILIVGIALAATGLIANAQDAGDGANIGAGLLFVAGAVLGVVGLLGLLVRLVLSLRRPASR
ncbi:hypothetical protein EDF46_0941 [Frondihabitans sp. PhB188]|uniref:hypothetical protein n=1 Tax=Frondihabitans sp. PhB188 TaxID=2485200 RepID=UPI000F4A59D1|nr:hypothetical protein [Frondihabitans sp. PhB188]ROQ41560.1 hypothetical protein EDF46_0941 [Frondihabitans sp. PhB188]